MGGGGGGGGRRAALVEDQLEPLEFVWIGEERGAQLHKAQRGVGAGGSRGNEWQDAAWKVAGGVPAPAARHAHGSPKVVVAHSRTR